MANPSQSSALTEAVQQDYGRFWTTPSIVDPQMCSPTVMLSLLRLFLLLVLPLDTRQSRLCGVA